MKELVEAGGVGYLIPAVLAALVFYFLRGLFGVYVQKSAARKEFLELWERSRSEDDVWLEVAVRHWIGTYLPAHVIRLALAQPDKTQSLSELSELWPFLLYDRATRTVQWRSPRFKALERSKLGRWIWMAGYVVLILCAMGYGVAAYQMTDINGMRWLYSASALVFFIFALAALMREDSSRVITDSGEEWIARINAAVSMVPAPQQTSR